METLYIEPGSPWENGYAESFHSRLRDEFLALEVFESSVGGQEADRGNGERITTITGRTARWVT